MAELNLSIVSSAEDGFDNGTVWNPRTGAYAAHEYFTVGERSGTEEIGGVRFTGVAIDQGTTITSATLTGVVHSNPTGGAAKALTLNVYGDDVDNAPVWSDSSRPGSGFTQTTASASATLGSGTRDALDAVVWDVTSIVQEIINRGGFANNNAIRFSISRDAGSPTYNRIALYDYDTDTLASIFTLDIVYPDGGGRSADSLTGAFRRGNTGVTVNCTGLDIAPTTQTVTVTDGTHSDTCTITNWNSGDPIINIDCALPPGSYDIQVTDDTGTVTLSGQTLLIETGYEEITYNGSTPPANEESLEAGTIGDYGFTPVANDKWGVTSHANVTWYADGQADINPAGTHTLPYWAWDESTGTMHTGQSIIIGEVPVLTNPALTSTGQNTQRGSADTNVNTGTMYGYWSTSVTPPSSTDLIAGTGAAYHGSLAITSTGTKTFNATGLVADTTYYAHFLHDNSGSESDISTSAGVATDSGTDITPDQFAFTDQTDVALSAVITSNTITVAGVDAGQNVPLTITNGEYSINGGGWASTPTNVQLGNTIQVRHTSSGSYTTAVNTTLDLNGVSDIFTSTTEANVPPVIDNQSFSILTGALAGSTTGPVVATDTDPLIFSITAGNTGGDWSIDANTGVLTVVNDLDNGRTATYNLTVQVDDTAATDTGTITINVIDVPEGTNAKLSLSLELGVE
ncbi:MAG: cadherin repeat domain-containing protein [Candidatus Thiodiazotropha endolucinida]